MDDVKPSAAAWEDWLHILDPYGTFSASARYHNTDEMAPHLVAVTTNYRPEVFAFSALVADDPSYERGQVDAFLRRPDLFIFCLDSDVFGTNHWVITRPVDSPSWWSFWAKNPGKRVAGDPENISEYTRIAFEPVIDGLVAGPQVAWTIAELICKRNNVVPERIEALCWSAVEHVATAMREAHDAGAVTDVLGYTGIAMLVTPFSEAINNARYELPCGLLVGELDDGGYIRRKEIRREESGLAGLAGITFDPLKSLSEIKE